MSNVEVRQDETRDRFVAVVDGAEVGVAGYRRDGETVVLTHTEVEREGEGIGSALARGTLDALAEQGATVRAECPFIAAYVRRHPQYAELVEVPGSDGGR